MNNQRGTVILALNLAVSVAVLVIAILLIREGEAAKPVTGGNLRRLAALYEANELAGPAVFAYERYLEQATLPPEEEAQLHYVLGNLYFDKAMNYESALAHYLAAQDMNPEAQWKTEAEKRVINCFERLGRKQDAQNRLDASTALVGEPAADDSPLLALVGKHEIRLSELENAVASMPQETREQLKGPEGVRPLLNQLIREWMLYDLAQKKGLEDDPQVKEQMEKGRKMFLANLAYQIEMDSRVKITDEEVKKFYDENPDEFKTQEGQVVPFDEIKGRIFMFLKAEKAKELDGDLMKELQQLSGVKVYQDALPKAK